MVKVWQHGDFSFSADSSRAEGVPEIRLLRPEYAGADSMVMRWYQQVPQYEAWRKEPHNWITAALLRHRKYDRDYALVFSTYGDFFENDRSHVWGDYEVIQNFVPPQEDKEQDLKTALNQVRNLDSDELLALRGLHESLVDILHALKHVRKDESAEDFIGRLEAAMERYRTDYNKAHYKLFPYRWLAEPDWNKTDEE